MARSKNKPIHTTKDVVQIAHRYLAYPTDVQVLSMENWIGSLCHLSNEAIQERKEAYKATGKGLTYREQQNALPKTLADRVHICPQCGLVLCRDTNSARVIEQRAFGKGTAQAEPVISTNTVGVVCSELVPDQGDKTPVEARASAAAALRGKSCR